MGIYKSNRTLVGWYFGLMEHKPAAFLSYTRLDDSDDDISRLRAKLEIVVRQVMGAEGQDFRIFQDTEGIDVGEHWPSKLDAAIANARFFIPVLTPGFFGSKFCSYELTRFRSIEEAVERKDLILPIYWRTADEVDNPGNHKDNPVAQLLGGRERIDWRELRNEAVESPPVRAKLDYLAEQIHKAWQRSRDLARMASPPPSSDPTPAPALPADVGNGERLAQLEQAMASLEEALENREAETDRLRTRTQTAEEELVAEKKRREETEKTLAAERGKVGSAARRSGADRTKLAAFGLSGALALALLAGGILVWQWFDEAIVQQVELQKKIDELKDRKTVEPAGGVLDLSGLTLAGGDADPPAGLAGGVPDFSGLKFARRDADPPYKLGEVFKDCDECPEMVAVPAGEFMMGSPEGEGDSNERPQHQVTIPKPFAVGKYEVTFDEWDACVGQGGCRGHKPKDYGRGRGRRPVINVSWNDAQAYVEWLIERTEEKGYRLLSEAEWEYAARAGTQKPYFFGVNITPDQANYDGNVGKTVAVGGYQANAFGIYDMHGNVWEWVEDRWHDSYQGAPDVASAWIDGTGVSRVLRGGSWVNPPESLRSANRVGDDAVNRNYYGGFRIAKTLTP